MSLFLQWRAEAENAWNITMAPVLSFTLSEEGVSALRDVLICLNKFNEEICLEAKKDQVCFISSIRISCSCEL